MTEVIVISYVYVLSTILPLIQALVVFNGLCDSRTCLFIVMG